MRTNETAAAAGWLAAGLLASACSGPRLDTRAIEYLSPVYTIDREYRSMVGPSSTEMVSFPEPGPPQLLWITAYRAVIVGADGETPMPQEFMCHSNLDFDHRRHSAMLGLPVYHTERLFTLSQGQFEIRLPPGFGLPYYSDETFTLMTQVLNLNPDDRTHQVRHKVSIEYVRDGDLEQPLKPLFMTSGWGLVSLEGQEAFFDMAEADPARHGPGCLPGDAASADVRNDRFGRRFSAHWVVKPGREVNRTLVTNMIDLPYDTSVHYIAVHLHPFAESLELVDRTTGESVFKSDVEQYDDKIGIDRVDYFASESGLPLFRDHEYELVSTYHNTTSEDQDSMAVMLLYLLDKEFKKIDRSTVRRVVRPVKTAAERAVLHTRLGDISIELYPDVAPAHVERFLELVRAGVYDTARFAKVRPNAVIHTGSLRDRSGPPLTPQQTALIRPLADEVTNLDHRKGTVSMPPGASWEFGIVLAGAPHLDEKHTIIGEVVDGLDTLDRMQQEARDHDNTPLVPIEIERAQVVLASRPG